MIAGHCGLAAAAKARVQPVPLWALMVASVWLDIIFVTLFLAGVETVEQAPGTDGGGYGTSIIHADFTHSLLDALLIAAVTALLVARWWGRSGAVSNHAPFTNRGTSRWPAGDRRATRGDLRLVDSLTRERHGAPDRAPSQWGRSHATGGGRCRSRTVL